MTPEEWSIQLLIEIVKCKSKLINTLPHLTKSIKKSIELNMIYVTEENNH